MILLAKVEDSFTLPTAVQAYGCVIVCQLLTGPVRVKDPIQLRTPDGQVKDTYIAGFEHVKHTLLDPPSDRIGLCLSREFTKLDAPPGTEIWSLGLARDSGLGTRN